MQRDRSCTILENNILKSKIEVLKSMFVMSNNSIKLCTKFGFCVSKFDHNCTQNLISGISGVETRLSLQDVQILYLMCWDLYTVHLHAYAVKINIFNGIFPVV